jgi:histidinol-phosphate/aromatic aminotransferase/cobyric acid decarboxylase-like protein/adenosyl cobinamide kinase/adenosyl cobinamide phosphate guanylyltransferase
MAELILVLGGTRSGKSAHAERLVAQAPAVRYVATLGAGGDEEAAARIAAHQARRPGHWATVEAGPGPGALAEAVAGAGPGEAVLVDGLGAWLAGAMAALGLFDRDDADARSRLLAGAAALAEAAERNADGPIIVVAEEAGMGVVPTGAGTRRWLDLHGEITQTLAAAAGRVLLVTAGRAVALPKEAGAPPATMPTAPLPSPALRAHGDRMAPPGTLDLAVNVHGDGPPPHVRTAVEAAMGHLGAYPDPGPALAAVADASARPAGEILLTAGAAEAFWLLAAVVKARLAVVVGPQFTEPEAALRAHGVQVAHVRRDPARGWALDPGAVPDEADLVVAGNPNNPTGTLDGPERIAALCRPGRVTLVDEAFMDFVPGRAASVLARRDLPGLVVTRSVTKLWGLAGLRAGWLAGPPGLVARCAAARQPWPVGAPALAALEVCAGDEAYRERVAAEVAAERKRLAAALGDLPGVTVYDGAANFLLFEVPDGPGVHAELLAGGVAVRPPTFPGLGPDFLRTAVATPAASDTLVTALQKILKGFP